MTVDTIKEIIEHPEPDEQASLASWMGARDSVAWDEQIASDFSADGPGIRILAEIDARIDSGTTAGFLVSRLSEPGV